MWPGEGPAAFSRHSPGKVQVPGFSDDDTYRAVVTKVARGLGVNTNPARVSLIVSNGLVRDSF